MRIAFITDKSRPMFVGGYETRVYEFARRLSQLHEVVIFTSLDSREAACGNVKFLRTTPTAFQRSRSGDRSLIHSALYGLSLITNRIRDFKPDVVIVEAIPYIHLASASKWLFQGSHIVVLDVLEAWEDFRYTTIPGLRQISHRIIKHSLLKGLSHADVILAISSATLNSLVRGYGVEPSKVTLLPLGADSELQAENYQATPKSYDFVTLGRLVRPKRITDFVEALAILDREAGWRGRAVIIGDGPMKREISLMVDRNGLSSRVDIAGLLSESDKLRYLQMSRVFVLASEREGFSLATLEAMNCGLPAVVARPQFDEVFGQGDFVIDQKNGLYFPVGNVRQLANYMLHLLRNPGLIETLGENAQRTAQEYSWNSLARRLEAILQSAQRHG